MIESSGEIEMAMRESGYGRGSDPARSLAGCKALVVGLGLTGRSVARFLAMNKASVTATDSRGEEELTGGGGGVKGLKEMGVTIKAGGLRSEDFLRARLIVISPGIPYSHPLLEEARARGIEVIGGLELASRFIRVPIIAIAGTNGKSTVTSLVGEVLAASGRNVFVGGNIGTPLVDYFLSDTPADICVLEVSSFQLESIMSFSPHIAVLLNITEDHLERYSSFSEYAAVKFRLFDNQENSDYAVVNAADPLISTETLGKAARLHGKARRLPFNCSAREDTGLYYFGSEVVLSSKGVIERYPVEAPGLKGVHNMENAMAAIAVLRLSGVGREQILEGLRSFKGLKHRMEFIRERGGVSFINDSKGTNTGALMKALQSTQAPIILIAGGRDKGGDYSMLAPLMAGKVRLLVALGEAAPVLQEAFKGVVGVRVVSTMEEAVETAAAEAAAGDTVLLSPACSSFDMFRDYRERGLRFTALVQALD
ncbi:MAG: UDP-N-acetylmuramoyl-L-alanine--D-glutamate ligase [Thermodesulfobacteriota bacterium]